jgi:hypothetical protein
MHNNLIYVLLMYLELKLRQRAATVVLCKLP